jgi:malate dehydrogenase (oxaloacetate-decarboxylating)(NADP+)
MCDRKGVIHKGRTDLDQWKSAHSVETEARTLGEALVGADVFLGLSAAGALKPEMVKEMADQPIIFAMANPDPEIWPPDAIAARPDAIIATGRSDFPNQVNNVLGFPFIFRGALDVRATAINDEMKIAAAEALAELAREPVPEEVAAAYGGQAQRFGRDYIIPAPFDPRLMEVVASAVAEAAIRSGVAQRPIEDFECLSAGAASPTQPNRVGAQPRLRIGEGEPEARAVRRGRGTERASGGDRLQGGRARNAGACRPRGRLRPAPRNGGRRSRQL